MLQSLRSWSCIEKSTSSSRSPRASALQQTASDLLRARPPDPVRPFPIRRYSTVRVAALRKTPSCVCCRPTSHTLLDRFLQQQRRRAFHTESRVCSPRLPTTTYICGRWPSLKVRVQDNRETQ